MANQNLSQFGEKLFVADADHTFIWDSAVSISKRVSRNSWLNSGTLTSDAPVTISQTWNNAAVAFTGLKFNAAGTSDANSAVASKLLELQVGGVSKFSVDKYGITTSFGAFRQTPTGAGINVSANGNRLTLNSNNATVAYLDGVNFVFDASAILAWSSSAASSGTFDTALLRDGAGQLALRNGAAAQTFRVYGAYPDTGINYARLALSCDTSGNATISTQALGTYTAGTVSINGVPVGRGKQNLSDNIGIGFSTLNSTSSGNYNTALGYAALQNGSGQDFNVAVGNYTLFNNNGDNNVAIGIQALWQKTTGARDTAIGSFAGTFFSGGSPNNNLVSNDSVFIGADTKPLASGETNQIVIGYNATGIGSNSVVLGNDSITKTALKGNVGIGTTFPSEKLHVLGGKVLFGDPSDPTGTAGNGELTLQARAFPQLNLVSNLGGTGFCGLNIKVGASDKAGFIVNTGSGEVRMGGLGTGGYFSTFYANAVEAMRILSGGNVGIGTTSPTSKLHVVGDAFLAANGTVLAPSLRIGAGANVNGWYSFGGLQLNAVVNSINAFGITTSGTSIQNGNLSFGLAGDLVLERDAQDELALRRGGLGQKFSVYGTYSNATAWERFTITAPTSGNVLLGTYQGTGGIARGLEFQTAGITRLTINSSGTSFFAGATRFDSFFYIGASNGISLQSGGASDGILLLQNSATNNFNRIQLGGSTDSFPALKRSTTRVQAVLATTETTFTNIQGKLTTDTDYTAGSISPTGFLTLYDAQGNAYKVPCVAA